MTLLGGAAAAWPLTARAPATGDAGGRLPDWPGASITGRSGAGETLFDSEPDRVAVPVLIVANKGDACPASPPGDAAKIAEALSQASRKEILYLESTTIKGSPAAASRLTATSVSSRKPSIASRSGSRRRK